MSEVSQASSSLPLPPMQYVNLYSEESLQRGRAPSPPKPVQESYSMFGVQFHTDDVIIRPLESQGIRRLYPHKYDHKQELKKLNHSILVNFLDMLDILIRCPDTSKREEKKEDISLLFIHIHHLINEFRPHQARETLRVMMEVQKRQRLETADRFQKHLERVFEILQGSLTSLLQTDSPEMDSKDMLCGSEGMPDGQWGSHDDTRNEPDTCSGLDRLMCDIVDAL